MSEVETKSTPLPRRCYIAIYDEDMREIDPKWVERLGFEPGLCCDQFESVHLCEDCARKTCLELRERYPDVDEDEFVFHEDYSYHDDSVATCARCQTDLPSGICDDDCPPELTEIETVEDVARFDAWKEAWGTIESARQAANAEFKGEEYKPIFEMYPSLREGYNMELYEQEKAAALLRLKNGEELWPKHSWETEE